MDVLFGTDVLEDFGPYSDTHLSDMGRAQQVHVGPGLSDAAPDAQRDLIVEDGLMIGEIEKIFLAGNLELDFKGLFGDADAHRSQLVASFCHRVPYQDITI